MSRSNPTLTLQIHRGDGGEILRLPHHVVQLRGPDGEVRSKPLGLEPLVVGSGADCSLVSADPSVSRQHCEIRQTEQGVVLRDLGSKNGTCVHGLRLLGLVLVPGIEVKLGNSVLTLAGDGGADEVPLSAASRFGAALGASPLMRALFARLQLAAASHESVLLLGETGTGKGVLARAIHDASPRRGGPFVVFDCGAVAPNLVEAELFGYVKGAFTGADSSRVGLLEQAHGGTLFLDELGELPLELQPKLLRAVECHTVRPIGAVESRAADVRVVCATNRDLVRSVSGGGFREDLYYRLAVISAEIPPLRQRKEDIPLLVESFLAGLDPPRTLSALPAHALEMLCAHEWPGNVRELRNTVVRMVLLGSSGGKVFERTPGPGPAGNLARLPLREAREAALTQFERQYLEAKLREHGGQVTPAADAMGVSRQYLYRLIARHGIQASSVG